jgi:PAP2 superfamily
MKQKIIHSLFILLIFSLSACSEKFSKATQNAIQQPSVWAPLLAATVIGGADKDAEISDWAQEETPVFGSTQSAVDASDNLVNLLVVSTAVSALLIPDQSDATDILSTNMKFVLVEGLGLSVNTGITNALKSEAGRTRPNDFDQRSFPSGHTSRAFTAATFAKHNIQQYDLDENSKKYFDWTFNSAAIATGWARVEAGWHYPSDVLAGAALGNVVASIISEMYLDTNDNVTISIQLFRDSKNIAFSFSF